MIRPPHTFTIVRTAWIAAAWTVVAIAWGPAAALAFSPNPSAGTVLQAIAITFASFVPWAFATPCLFGLCRRNPLGEGRNATSMMVLLLAAVLVVPGLTMIVPILQRIGAEIWPAIIGAPQSAGDLARRILVTSLFALPTYVAVIAIGQTLVWAGRARDQEARSARTELRALRAELSPHFLMNALGSIAQIAHVSADRAEAALSALADVLRGGLMVEAETQTLADELGAVDEHLMLYRELTGALDYQRHVGDGLWHRLVPSRILIPLIENALTHGAALSDGTRQLTIRVANGPSSLRIEVSNPASTTPRPSNGLSSGLAQVQQRLTLLYRERFGMTASLTGEQFNVVLDLPNA